MQMPSGQVQIDSPSSTLTASIRSSLSLPGHAATDGWRTSLDPSSRISQASIAISLSGGGSTGRGILIGLLSAFGSAGFIVLVLAVFFFFRFTQRGRILLDRFGRPGEFDDEQAFAREEAEALESMDDLQRVEYLRAKAFVQANPPETVQTDISLSQFLAIQEKGVSAWEFEPELEIANCFVEARTEIEFFDSECSVQSNLPVPKQNEIYYWEAKIYDKPETSLISIGMTTKPYPLFRLPGYHKTSVAYISTGHRRFNQPFTPTSYGPNYVQGDVIGVGYRPRTGTIFFTRNGKKLDEFAHNLKTQNFFPTVGANGPCTVHVNFGQLGFVFIEANVKKWGLAPMTGSLAPPPPYGSEQGSILLESGREGVRQPEYQPGHSRTRSGLARLGLPSGNTGPQRSPTDISLAQLAHVPSQEVQLGSTQGMLDMGDIQHQPVENTSTGQQIIPPPEYSSPPRTRSNSNEEDHENQASAARGQPPIPTYDGPSGGPREDNVTGLLVHAPQSEWRKGSLIAVDAGAHLAAIIHLLNFDIPIASEVVPEPGYTKILDKGPFKGIKFPHISAKANALYIFRELLHSVLITHPHLDHLSAIAINTPALEYGREAKAIVALPSVIDAIKDHIFNDSIWPNLSDEGNGVGFITYRRLIEGGNPRLGYGEARGYVNVCDGLATKCWSVTHGKCPRKNFHISHRRGESVGWAGGDNTFSSRRASRISDHGYFSVMAEQQAHHVGGLASGSGGPLQPGAMTPGIHPGTQSQSAIDNAHLFEPVASSAFFIRNDVTGQEILVFGDIEPDSVSFFPRNHIVWEDAASKIAQGVLKAIFIECSYDESVRDADLYGHLCPRHLICELTFLARCVVNAKKQVETTSNSKVEMEHAQLPTSEINLNQPPTTGDARRKRKRDLSGDLNITPELEPTEIGSPPVPEALHNSIVTRSTFPTPSTAVLEQQLASSTTRSVQFQAPLSAEHPSVPKTEKLDQPLKGLGVHIIHVKETLMDGPAQGDIILKQLKSLSDDVGLGVEFDVTSYGEVIWV
ncbi:hypothetical protein DV736_g2569, partial [Chaetothyriales sp. CBS 134916]